MSGRQQQPQDVVNRVMAIPATPTLYPMPPPTIDTASAMAGAAGTTHPADQGSFSPTMALSMGKEGRRRRNSAEFLIVGSTSTGKGSPVAGPAVANRRSSAADMAQLQAERRVSEAHPDQEMWAHILHFGEEERKERLRYLTAELEATRTRQIAHAEATPSGRRTSRSRRKSREKDRSSATPRNEVSTASGGAARRARTLAGVAPLTVEHEDGAHFFPEPSPVVDDSLPNKERDGVMSLLELVSAAR